MNNDRRTFLKKAGVAAALLPTIASLSSFSATAKIVRVVVWDERHPDQKQAYENFLGNAIAEHLGQQPGFTVRSVALDDPQNGLSDDIINNCDVLIWWGHQRQDEITKETGKKIVQLIADGKLALISLHSAHWSTPFVESMNELTRISAEAKKRPDTEITYVDPPVRYTVPKYDARITPYTDIRKFPDGSEKHTVHLPYCCFPAFKNDGKPSSIHFINAHHPIAKGVPKQFDLPKTEMYDEAFHVPEPDEVIIEERWASGEWFRSGMVWKLGKGKIFYFRPGHESYPIYKQQWPLAIISNAVRWLANG